jgi:PAS domain S-box-containing protein
MMRVEQGLHRGAEFARPRARTMAETPFEELKRYVRFDERDARTLRAFRAVAAPHFERIARDVSARLGEHDATHAVLTGQVQRGRLQRSLSAWMARMLSGSYTEAHAEATRAIGVAYARVGAPPRYLFTAMTQIRELLASLTDTLTIDAIPTRVALTRILDLELALVVESCQANLDGARAAPWRRTDEAALYPIILDLVPDLVIGLDERYTMRFVNRSARTITGYANEDLIDAPFLQLLVPDDLQPACLRYLDSLIHGAAHPDGEQTVIRTRIGKPRDVVWCFHRLTTEVGHGVVILVVGTDVTDTRLAAQRIQRHQKLLAIGTLAAGLAHEIRNPLNTAQLHVSFLRRLLDSQRADPEALEAIAVIQDEIKRLARLVSEFLTFAEPKPLVKSPGVVQDILARAVAAAASPPGIAVVIRAPAEALVIVADCARLELVVLNLLENAIDALEPARVGEIGVRVRREPRAVVLEVEDDGPGLPSPDAPVFDAFYTTKPAGSGLGLAVTHRIVTDHGGTIDVESRPGRTCFRVMLPVDDVPRAPGERRS